MQKNSSDVKKLIDRFSIYAENIKNPGFKNPDRYMHDGPFLMPYIDIGLIDYSNAFDLQLKIFDIILREDLPGCLLLLEHKPVITIGNSQNRNNLISSEESLETQGIDLIQSNRGGDVTFHGPGQLVCYPIFNLAKFDRDLTGFVYKLEQLIIDVLDEYKIKGTRIEKLRGVFVGKNKIASIGIHVKKWITLHGFSLNVSVDLGYYKNIIACGLSDYTQISMEKLLDKKIPLSFVKELVLESFASVFKVKLYKLDDSE
jgi:lipoyl(octanoyl) transferase